MWIPTISTLDIGAQLRFSADNVARSLNIEPNLKVVDSVGKEEYQYMNYHNTDAITLQSLLRPNVRQLTTIDTITKSDLQPRSIDEIMANMPQGGLGGG